MPTQPEPARAATLDTRELVRPKPFSHPSRPAKELWDGWKAYCETDDTQIQDFIEWLYYNATPEEVVMVFAHILFGPAAPRPGDGDPAGE